MRTQVAIVGAGPAGLLLSHLLHLQGVESVILEKRGRQYALDRVRAGVLEDTTVRLLDEVGLGERLRREALRHDGFELRFGGERHRIPISALTGGRPMWVYGQQKVVADLLDAHDKTGTTILFEVSAVQPLDLNTDTPRVRFVHDGRQQELQADVVAGCDGFHGVCRQSVPEGAFTSFEREFPIAWLGVLADVAPSTGEVIYAYHERGLGMHSMRSPQVSRLYVQCAATDTVEQWPDERIWSELHERLAIDEDWELTEGPITEKSVAVLRSLVVEPMRYHNLFLAGDAAHIVPPAGAKGLNLAVSDVRVLAEALTELLRHGRSELADTYSDRCLRHGWRVQRFSTWLTEAVHRMDDDPYKHRLRLAQLDHLVRSESASRDLAENYVGLPL